MPSQPALPLAMRTVERDGDLAGDLAVFDGRYRALGELVRAVGGDSSSRDGGNTSEGSDERAELHCARSGERGGTRGRRTRGTGRQLTGKRPLRKADAPAPIFITFGEKSTRTR